MGMDPGAGLKRLCCAAAFAVGLAACASSGPDIATLTSNSDQAIWDAGQKALQRKDWINARQLFRRIIDGFPQSPHGAEARLAVGETYVKEGGSTNDLLAVGAFREFLTLYPSHPKSDYAQFQVAEAYFRRRNSPDRDQTDTKEAVAEFQRLLDLYPDSPLAEEARARVTEARQSLARAEFLAGYFYQRTRELCRASIARYEVVLREYPDYKALDEVLFRLAECLQTTGRGAEALPHLGRLLEEYPKSSWAEPAKQLMATAASAPPVPSPAPPAPSPAPEKPSAIPSPAA
jgi:outer membrane protein assembly factor BamD